MAPRLGRQICRGLTATAAITVTAAVITAAQIAAAVAEQDHQQDDPAQIATAEAVITKVTHKDYLPMFDAAVTAHPILCFRRKYVRPDAPGLPHDGSAF